MTTHIVCRECEFEGLVEGAFRAEEQVETHEDATGHRVEHEFIGHNETGRLVTDGGREKRRVQIGQVETVVYTEETVANLFDRTEGPLEVTPVNTVLCRPFSGGPRPSPPDEEEYISFDLAEIEDGDALELYRLPISERPAYEEALRADGGTVVDGGNDYRRQAEELLTDVHADRVFAVEEDVVWVSGMNAGCPRVARKMARTLVMHDIPAGLVYDDDAVEHGGVQFNYGDAA